MAREPVPIGRSEGRAARAVEETWTPAVERRVGARRTVGRRCLAPRARGRKRWVIESVFGASSYDAGPALIVDVVDTPDGLLRLESKWRPLWEAAGTLPFTSWEWSLSWWRHLSRQGFGVKDRLCVRTVTDEKGQLVAVAPLMLTDMPSRGPVRFRCLQFFGADPNITELRGVLCRPEQRIEVYHALLDHLFERSSEWDWIVWDGIPPDSDVARLVGQYGPFRVAREISSFVLELPATWEEFKSTRSRNIKESLRKCANSLKRDGLVPVNRVAEGGRELDGALHTLVRLHAARSSRTDTIVHRDVFGTASAKRFLFEVCARFAAAGGVRVFSLELESRVVAARVAFVWGQSMYLYYSGYDPSYSKYSVMTSVVAEALRYAIAHGYRTVNLSTGNDLSKTRWSPIEIKHHQGVQASNTLRGPLAESLYVELRRAVRVASTYAGRAVRNGAIPAGGAEGTGTDS
jgi:CelD/BcsL family acetyltransferase involved in cellulose biosynthesis